jgi:hypothetical protein
MITDLGFGRATDSATAEAQKVRAQKCDAALFPPSVLMGQCGHQPLDSCHSDNAEFLLTLLGCSGRVGVRPRTIIAGEPQPRWKQVSVPSRSGKHGAERPPTEKKARQSRWLRRHGSGRRAAGRSACRRRAGGSVAGERHLKEPYQKPLVLKLSSNIRPLNTAVKNDCNAERVTARRKYSSDRDRRCIFWTTGRF